MLTIKKLWLTCLVACVILLAQLGGCATHKPLDVGQVVVAPPVQLPPPPVLVQTVEPKPVGYFQSLLQSYFSGSPEKPTTSTTPTPAVVQTHTQ